PPLRSPTRLWEGAPLADRLRSSGGAALPGARQPGLRRIRLELGNVLSENLDQCVDTTRVEGCARLFTHERQGFFDRPGGPVHARGDESVIDVAHGQNPRLEVQVRRFEAPRLTPAIQALV